MNYDVKRIGQNIPEEEIEPGMQVMVMFNIDSSGSMDRYKQEVRNSLAVCKEALEGSSDPIQVSYTTFDEEIRVQSFQYVQDVDYTYSPRGRCTRFYDSAAIVAMDMYDRIRNLNSTYGAKGGIIMLTDGMDNKSKPESRQIAIDSLRKLKTTYNTPIIVGMLGEPESFMELMAFCEESGIIPISIDDHRKLRKLMKLFSSSMSTGNLNIINNPNKINEFIEG